jgi:hypothetical protein
MLIERLGINVRHFAFPCGRSADCGPRDFELAREAVFARAATSRKAGPASQSHKDSRARTVRCPRLIKLATYFDPRRTLSLVRRFGVVD